MTISRFTLFTTILLTATCYAISRTNGQDPHPEHSATAEADAHEGHDHDEHAGRGHEEHGEDNPDEHAGHEHEEHAEEDPDEHAGHDDEGGILLDDETMREFGIKVEPAAAGSIALQTILPGEVTVNEDRQAHIVPRYPGLVIEVKKNIGDHVERGEVLAVLEGNESLANYELKSLMDGTIIEKHITLGESLGDDAAVFTVADLKTVWVELTVFQKNLRNIHEGDPVSITLDKESSDSTISYVSPTLDGHTRTALARVVLDNPDGLWRPGMFVTGHVTVGADQGAVVAPASAVQVVGEESVVFIPGDEGFITRTVETGRRNRDRIEILSGLDVGESYVAEGAFHLKAEIITSGLDPHAGHGH